MLTIASGDDRKSSWKKNDLISSARARKFDLRELALLKWLAGAPADRFAMSVETRDLKTFLRLYEKQEPRADGLREVVRFETSRKTVPTAETAAVASEFGGRIEAEIFYLRLAGYVSVVPHATSRFGEKSEPERFNACVSDVYLPGSWPLSAAYVAITDDGIAFWNASGSARHAQLLEKVEEKNRKLKTLERRAVFGWSSRFDRRVPPHLQDIVPGVEVPLPVMTGIRPRFAATVVRETATRLYIRDATNDRGYASLRVAGSGVDRYVERKDLILDNASEEAIRRLFAFDEAEQQEHYGRCERAAEEIVPILKRMLDSKVQTNASHADMFAELLASLKEDEA